jgi:hypothetical protein
VVAVKAAEKIEKLRGPQDATMRRNKEKVRAMYRALPNGKKTRKVERIHKKTGLGRSTIWRYLSGV